jgi:hypothetical protein
VISYGLIGLGILLGPVSLEANPLGLALSLIAAIGVFLISPQATRADQVACSGRAPRSVGPAVSPAPGTQRRSRPRSCQPSRARRRDLRPATQSDTHRPMRLAIFRLSSWPDLKLEPAGRELTVGGAAMKGPA